MPKKLPKQKAHKSLEERLAEIQRELNKQQRLARAAPIGTSHPIVEQFATLVIPSMLGYLFVEYGPYRKLTRPIYNLINQPAIPPEGVALRNQVTYCADQHNVLEENIEHILDICQHSIEAARFGGNVEGMTIPHLEIPFTVSDLSSCARLFDHIKQHAPHLDLTVARRLFFRLITETSTILNHITETTNQTAVDLSRFAPNSHFSLYTSVFTNEISGVVTQYCEALAEQYREYEPLFGAPWTKQALNIFLTTACILTIKYAVVDPSIRRILSVSCRPFAARSINIENIVSTEQAAVVLKDLQNHTIAMEKHYHTMQKNMQRIALILLPLLIVLLLSLSQQYPELLALVFILVTSTFENFVKQAKYMLEKRRYYHQLETTIKQLEIMTASLGSWQFIKSDNPEETELIFKVCKYKKKIKEKAVINTFLAILKRHNINVEQIGYYRLLFDNNCNLNSVKAQQIRHELLNYLNRLTEIKNQDSQLKIFHDNHIEIMIEPYEAQGLPSRKIYIDSKKYELFTVTKTAFKNCVVTSNDNNIMISGYQPATNHQCLVDFFKSKQAMPSPESVQMYQQSLFSQYAPKERTALRHRIPAMRQPTERPRASERDVIQVTWPSGAYFNSNDLETCAVKHIDSRFNKPYTHFLIFEIPEPAFETHPGVYKEFAQLAQFPRFAPPHGAQGVIPWIEEHNFTQYHYDETGKATRQKQIHYKTSVKLKLLGKQGDSRCYGYAEQAPTGEILHHIIEFDSNAH